jgi:hypothetical protein
VEDIVERLRAPEKGERVQSAYAGVRHEAADEIERLRKELACYHEWHASLLDCRIPLVAKLLKPSASE